MLMPLFLECVPLRSGELAGGQSVDFGSPRTVVLGVAGRIQCSGQVHALLQDSFQFEPRGEVDIKGKGTMSTYFLTGVN